jgi:hypothetical protein
MFYQYGTDANNKVFYQYGTDANNKVIDSYLLVSQVYNNIIHNNLKSNHRKNTFDHFSSVFS